jgi:hypothetical protein
MSRLYNRTTEGDESRPCPISSGQEDVGNDRRTGGAGQQHSSEPFLICHPAKHAGRVVAGVALISESHATCPFASQDKPLQPARELEASAVEVIKDGLESRSGIVSWRLRFHRMAYPIGHGNRMVFSLLVSLLCVCKVAPPRSKGMPSVRAFTQVSCAL